VPDRVLLEEFHLSLTVPRSTPDVVREATRRVLTSRPFRVALRAAVLDCLRKYPTPARVGLTVTT
jgi:hypothetical protein